jgi:hypothetical protein
LRVKKFSNLQVNELFKKQDHRKIVFIAKNHQIGDDLIKDPYFWLKVSNSIRCMDYAESLNDLIFAMSKLQSCNGCTKALIEFLVKNARYIVRYHGKDHAKDFISKANVLLNSEKEIKDAIILEKFLTEGLIAYCEKNYNLALLVLCEGIAFYKKIGQKCDEIEDLKDDIDIFILKSMVARKDSGEERQSHARDLTGGYYLDPNSLSSSYGFPTNEIPYTYIPGHKKAKIRWSARLINSKIGNTIHDLIFFNYL